MLTTLAGKKFEGKGVGQQAMAKVVEAQVHAAQRSMAQVEDDMFDL